MPKVLVVDDEQSIRWTMAELLKREGYNALTASDFDSAISLIMENEIDAALIDIILPRKSGIDLLKRLQQHEHYIPVIMITGEPNISLLPEIVRAGAYDFISKPVSKESLINAVSKAVEKKRLVEEKRRLEQEVKQYAEHLEQLVTSRTRELMEMRDRLAHNEKIAALGRMAAQVAHEVKNPLAGLRLYSLHLKSKAEGKLGQGEMSLVDKIIGGIDHLSETVEQVLNFARPLQLTRKRVDLNRLVGDSIQLLEPQLSANKIKVELRLREEGAFAGLDESSMRSTLINLLLNSIQAMPEGGRLTVTTWETAGELHLEVEDTGVGMTDEQVKNVFEPFYTTKSQGLGLGMSYAQKVIQQHGGEVAVASQTGIGTRIMITLMLEDPGIRI